MIETPCSFCCTLARRPDGKPFTCPTCLAWFRDGRIRTITIPPESYTEWGNWWDQYKQTRPLWQPSDRILRASS